MYLCLLHDVDKLFYVVGQTVAEGDTMSSYWWILLIAVLVAVLAVALVIFIICFVTRSRRRKRLRLPTGNILVVVHCSHCVMSTRLLSLQML